MRYKQFNVSIFNADLDFNQLVSFDLKKIKDKRIIADLSRIAFRGYC